MSSHDKDLAAYKMQLEPIIPCPNCNAPTGKIIVISVYGSIDEYYHVSCCGSCSDSIKELGLPTDTISIFRMSTYDYMLRTGYSEHHFSSYYMTQPTNYSLIGDI